MIPALDYLAGTRYQKEIVKSHPAGWGAGFFAETFGDSFKTARALLKTGRCPFIRTHLLWSDNHLFGDKDIPKIKKLAKKWNKLALEFPTVRVELSPFCEHNLKSPDKYLEIVAKEAPQCHVTNTPWKGAVSKKFKNEVHGDHKAPKGRYNYSFDGTNCVDVDVEKFKERHWDAEYFFYWHPRFNLKYSMKDPANRPKRIAEAKQRAPSPDFIEAIAFHNTERGNVKYGKDLKLNKSFAEKHDAKDLKGDKQLIISGVKSNKIQLCTKAGALIDTLNYYGPFDGGGHRYYSARMAYKNSKLALASTGSPHLEVWIQGKNIGSINPGFRGPYFHD